MRGGAYVDNQIIHSIASHITDKQSQLCEQYECTSTDYHLNELDRIDELINYIKVEDIMLNCGWDFYYDLYEV